MQSSRRSLVCVSAVVLVLVLAMLPLGASAITGTQTVLSAAPNPAVIGQILTYTATISPTPDGGTVDFKEGSNTICASIAVTSGTASCNETYGSTGTHTLQAFYSGTSNFGASASNLVTEVINTKPTTLNLTSTATTALVGQPITYSVSISPVPDAGTMTLSDNGVPVACSSETFDLSGVITCTLTYGIAGGHTITANYSGSAKFSSSNATLTETINPAPTTTTLNIAPNPANAGQSVTFSATVTVNSPGSGTPTGAVIFKEGNTTLGAGSLNSSGQATFSTSQLSQGSHTITATYGGSDTYGSSTSGSVTLNINGISTSTTVSASQNPVVVGQSVTYTASVSPSSPGSVTFYDGGNSIAGCAPKTLSLGQATCSVTYTSAGSHDITVSYGGDSTHVGSISGALTETVNQASTSTTLDASTNSTTAGQSVTFTANVIANVTGAGIPTGTVTFSDGANVLGSVPVDGTGAATLSTSGLAVGPHSITATYSGDANFLSSTSMSKTVSITAIATGTTIGSSLNPIVVGQDVTYSATVSPVPSGGTVAFSDGGNSIGSCASQPVDGSGIATCSVRYANVGSHTISASYSGDSTHNSSNSGDLTETVNQATTSTDISASLPSVTTGQSVTFHAEVAVESPGSGLPTGSVTFKEGTTILATVPLDGSGNADFTTSSLPAGNHSITAVYSGGANFLGSTSPAATVAVSLIETTTAIGASAGTVVVGQPVTYTASLDPVPSGGTVAFTDGGNPINGCGSQPIDGSGKATCTQTYSSVGSHDLAAAYGGDSTHSQSSSGTVTVTVNQAATTIALSSPANPSLANQPVTFTAQVAVSAPGAGTPSGTVTLMEGSNTIGTASLASNGTATFTTSALALGTHNLRAVYSGDGNFVGSGSDTLSQTVTYKVSSVYTLIFKQSAYFAVRPSNYYGQNVSSQQLPVTALCVVADSGSVPSSCGPNPALSLNAPFTFTWTFDKSRWYYSYSISSLNLTSGANYYLLVQVGDDPIPHTIPFTAR